MSQPLSGSGPPKPRSASGSPAPAPPPPEPSGAGPDDGQAQAGVYREFHASSARRTLLAFWTPTLAACFAPPRLRYLHIPPLAIAYTLSKGVEPTTLVEPHPGTWDRSVAEGLRLLPFIPAFGLQAQCAKWAEEPGSAMHKLASLGDDAFKGSFGRLPGSVGAAMRKFPSNFLVARTLAQLAATASGAAAADVYLLFRTGGTRVMAKPDDKGMTVGAAPVVAALCLFSIPTILASPGVWPEIVAHHGPPRATALLTGALCGMAVATHEVIQHQKPEK